MALRGYTDRSPVHTDGKEGEWPHIYIDEPYRQIEILRTKYLQKEQGRIPLPKNAQQLWSHHKYSILARDTNFYKEIGPKLSGKQNDIDFPQLAKTLTEKLRTAPATGGIRNALQHMWGHVSNEVEISKGEVETWSLSRLFEEIQKRAITQKEPYLLASTALSELKVWIPG